MRRPGCQWSDTRTIPEPATGKWLTAGLRQSQRKAGLHGDDRREVPSAHELVGPTWHIAAERLASAKGERRGEVADDTLRNIRRQVRPLVLFEQVVVLDGRIAGGVEEAVGKIADIPDQLGPGISHRPAK